MLIGKAAPHEVGAAGSALQPVDAGLDGGQLLLLQGLGTDDGHLHGAAGGSHDLCRTEESGKKETR